MLTPEQIAQFAKQFHIDPLSILREYLQVLFLARLSRDPQATAVYFKGGTAIRLLKDSFRFSEDLDFTVTAPARRTLQLLEDLTGGIQREVPEVSFRRGPQSPRAITGHLRYTPLTLKLPLVIRLQCSLGEQPRHPTLSLLETPYPVTYPWIQHLDWPEILAEKVRALLTRRKGRDLFDLWFLLSKGVPLQWPLIRTKMRFYRRTASPKDLIAAIQAMDSRTLQQDLGPFLPEEHRRLPGELKHRVLAQIG